MAKGMKVRDQLPNRHYETWTMGAAMTTCTYSSFDCVMGGIGPYLSWLVERVEFMPVNMLAFVPATDVTTRFQLCTGEQTALLGTDSPFVVCTKDLSCETTTGNWVFEMPITWVGPVLVANRKMTALMDSSGDNPPAWRNQQMQCTIWFKWVEMDKDTWYEVQQAKGILT